MNQDSMCDKCEEHSGFNASFRSLFEKHKDLANWIQDVEHETKSKTSKSVFQWIIGILASVLIALTGWVVSANISLNDKLDRIHTLIQTDMSTIKTELRGNTVSIQYIEGQVQDIKEDVKREMKRTAR